MHHQRSLVDLSLGVLVLLVVSALMGALLTHTTPAPKVLAQSTTCANDPGQTSMTEGGTQYRWLGYPECRWEQITDDPFVPSNNTYCCLSNGDSARCVVLRAGESCQPNALEPDVRLFSGYSNNQSACETQRRTGSCSLQPAASSAESSESSSAASCGNNTLEQSNGEECDWGTDNSDSLPNRCRSSCSFPICGDGVLDDNFSDPATGMFVSEECENVDYNVNGTQYAAVSPTQWVWNAHEYCNNDCTVKRPANPLFFMFPKKIDRPLYIVRPVFDWSSIFFPFSSVSF
ncbi:hypothetical protein AUJ46_06300 [Candidatus Peregrinibacteria bacterium CG1_02_54_53]|nr:MAG: hypothetical protein AUJ46_06300 [Candidatus Peregrinibacteria bacterium CG1_02_54_53]